MASMEYSQVTPNKNQPGKQFLSDTDLGISKCIEDCIVSKPSLFDQLRAARPLPNFAQLGCFKNVPGA